MIKKYILDLSVRSATMVHERYVLLRLTHDAPLPPVLPGQFAEVRIDQSPTTFLRRPISLCYVDEASNELWLLVACVGDGTRHLATLRPGDVLNCVLPLGNGFSALQSRPLPHPILIGGGVGVAPLLLLGARQRAAGIEPTFLLGARRSADLLLLDEFRRHGRVFVTTEDGSEGERGFVTDHSILRSERFTHIFTCGPTPMMKAVARFARQSAIPCEASLENMMACGLGACLCCVEKTRSGNLCVCKDGPVFNIDDLLWELIVNP